MKPKLRSSGAGGVRTAGGFLLLSAFAAQLLAQSSQDFGDAPAPYPTLLSNNGARHTAVGPLLGALRDTENDGIPSTFAQGDDSTANDDEDGVELISALVPGQTATIQVTVSNPLGGTARLDAWLDFAADGSWAQAGDRIFTNRVVFVGVNTLTFNVPAGANIGATFARFRLSLDGVNAVTGLVQEGEVEDYRVGITEAMDFGDAPTNNYPTLLGQGGARHRVVNNFMLGTKLDSEPDGQPNSTATGDDINPSNNDDEDGVTLTSGLVAGSNASVRVVVALPAGVTTGRLNAWMDFNRDGDWNDSGEQIFNDATVISGTNNLSFPVPGSASGGLTFARYRLNANGKIGPNGSTTEGEVEDYQVSVTAALDYGDAPSPYPTLLAQNGARHTFANDFCLGTVVDGETDGQPHATAKGDDDNPSAGPDDEDGVTFLSGIAPGGTASIQVLVKLPVGANGGYLNAWLDFNRDNDWADAGEQIFSDRVVSNGINNLTFTVPAGASQGSSFARFRLSSARLLSFTGATGDGEVEDYPVNISQNLDYGDAPQPYPTLLAANGARHTFSSDIYLGFRVDTEPDGQPEASALGDDLNGPDEDGVTFTSPLIPGVLATVQVRASVTGFLTAWVDFDGNGSWAQANEKIFNAVVISGGVNNLSFTVPATARKGVTFARFRFTTQTSVLDFTGQGPVGEVEDYQVSIITDRERCDLDCEGREFWLTFPGNYAPDPDNLARLSFCVHGPAGTAVAISAPGIGFTTNIVIPAAQWTTVPLPRAVELGDLNDVVTNKGIHVLASNPIGIQAFDHAKFTTDSYLALHTSVIGTEYVVQSAPNLHTGVPPLNGTQFALVACESNTVVTITPSVATGGHPAGVPYNLVLQPGDAYQLRNTNDAPADLTGTLIKSDKPIAVFGSHRCANVPSENEWFCNYLVEQLLPVNTWGNDFYTAPLATRSSGDTFRFLAAYDNTDTYLNGAYVTTLNRGQFVQGPLVNAAHITSSKPIMVTQYANSGDYDGNTNADPFMLTLQAVRHYANSYRVCTPTNDFPTNFVNVIALSGSIAGTLLDGAPIPGPFTPIGATAYSYARVPISPGSHTVTSASAPFACYVYGWAEYDAYGHPACFYFGDVMPPTINSPYGSTSASVNDHPNTPGFVPTPNVAGASSVQDNCDQQPTTPTQTPRSSTLVPPGVHTITLTVQDYNGNIGESNITFTVLDPSPVVINCPSNLVVNCQSNNGAIVNFAVTAHSTYDTNVPVVSTPPSGGYFPAGTTVVTNVATSLAGQSNSCTFTVTVACNPQINIARGANGLTLSWLGTATLESKSNIAGIWSPVPNATSPYIVPTTGPQQYFRVRY